MSLNLEINNTLPKMGKLSVQDGEGLGGGFVEEQGDE